MLFNGNLFFFFMVMLIGVSEQIMIATRKKKTQSSMKMLPTILITDVHIRKLDVTYVLKTNLYDHYEKKIIQDN